MSESAPASEYLNPKDFYSSFLQSWTELWDNNKTIYANVASILEQSVWLPEKDLLVPVATIYILLPSKWSMITPILFAWGDKGSGKSTLSMLANYIHGFSQTFSPTDTFASIRNALDAMRWLDGVTKDMERDGALLAWDNIHAETLKRDPRIYQLLLFGYNRNTDRISIADSTGKNKDYHVFCPKIISSVEPLHINQDFSELHRRLLLIPHKPFDKFSASERKPYEGLDLNLDKIDLQSISWDGIDEKFHLFWNTKENVQNYVFWRNLLTRKGKKPFKVPKAIKGERWTIMIDLLCTGLTIGAFSEVQQAIDFFAKYWAYVDKHFLSESSATLGHLRLLIDEEVGIILKANKEAIKCGNPTIKAIIQPQKLRERLNFLQQTGQLDISPKTKDINTLMWELGWKLTTEGWVER